MAPLSQFTLQICLSSAYACENNYLAAKNGKMKQSNLEMHEE